MGALVLVIVVVAVLAVNGSRAQPLPAVSVAARQCSIATPTALCRPLIGGVSAVAEREYEADFAGDGDGNDVGDPDWHWQQLAARAVVIVASWFAEHFGRAYVPDGLPTVSETVFDLAR
jgi:hypothetical protein